VHGNDKAIKVYRYLEYGEVWFDGHNIATGARNMEVKVTPRGNMNRQDQSEEYEVKAFRCQDHLQLNMSGPYYDIEAIVALSDSSKSVYVAVRGEDCVLSNVRIVRTDNVVAEDSIPRIADKVSYINRLESDIPNVQVDRLRSAYSQGVEIRDGMKIDFHTMSLPSAELVWNCPYVVLYYSDDSLVNGKGYKEYALIKLNGENDFASELVDSKFDLNKREEFEGWDSWKKNNKRGMECELLFRKKGNKITLYTTNLGIDIENTITLNDDASKVYVALTGDRIALTDIRVL
jgi:hypothetical protein